MTGPGTLTQERNNGGSKSLRERDSRTDFLLGGFFLLLGLAVLAGVFFAELVIDRVINAAAGLLLLAVGGGFLWRGRALGG